MRRFLFLIVCVLFVPVLAAEEVPPPEIVHFDGIQIRILKKDGTELKPKPPAEESRLQRVGGASVHFFEIDKQNFLVKSCLHPESKIVVYRVKAPFPFDGNIHIGLDSPWEKHSPEVVVKGNRAEVKISKHPIYLGWYETGEIVLAKPKKKLEVSLAEYGANDRWRDVTKIVNKLISSDSLFFRAGNDLFGDPAGGVVKSLVLNYSLDDDERIETFGENQMVRIQHEPKDRLIRLVPKGTDVFEFAFRLSDRLPDELPSYEQTEKKADEVMKSLIPTIMPMMPQPSQNPSMRPTTPYLMVPKSK